MKGRVISPPLESQEWNSSGYTTTTVALSAAGSSDDPFTVGSISIPTEIADNASHSKIAGSTDQDEHLDHIHTGPITDPQPSQVSVPRSSLERIPRGPAMEDLEDLDVDEIKVPMEETANRSRELYTEERPPIQIPEEQRRNRSHDHISGEEGEGGLAAAKEEMFSLAPLPEPYTPTNDTRTTSTFSDDVAQASPTGQRDAPADPKQSPGRSDHSQPVKDEQPSMVPCPGPRLSPDNNSMRQQPEEARVVPSPSRSPQEVSTSPSLDANQQTTTIKDEQFTLPPIPDIVPSATPQPACQGADPPLSKQEPQSLVPVSDDGPGQLPTPSRTSQVDHVPPHDGLDGEQDRMQKTEPESIKPTTMSPLTPHRRRVDMVIPSQASTGPVFTPASRLSPTTQNSPLIESQIGPHNTHLFRHDSPSPSRSPRDVVMGTSLPASSPPLPFDNDIMADDMGSDVEMGEVADVVVAIGATQSPTSGQEVHIPTSSPDAIDLLARRSPSLTPLPETMAPVRSIPPVESVPVDPALERFRGARSFRTRTTLQLQPYTRERLLYEAALRKGGLKTGKRAIGAPKEISQPDNGDDYSASRGEPPSTDQTDPEAIVIEPTPPPPPPPKILEIDYDEYYILHDRRIGPVVTEDEQEELERIAKLRLDTEKAERRRERESRRMQKRLERFRREQERGDPDDETYRPMPVASALKRKPTQAPREKRPSGLGPRSTAAPKPTGKIATYTKRYRDRSLDRPPVEPTSESEASAGMRPSNVTVPSPSARPISPDLGGYGDFDHPNFDDAPQEIQFNSPPRTVSSGSESEGSSSDGLAQQDKRARAAAAKMFPAVMLRRMEREEARKEQEKQAAKKRQDRYRSPSPIRPGRAIVRRGNGDGGDFANFLDEVAAGPSSPQSRDPAPEQGFESEHSIDRPIFVGSSDSDSQAEEDHGIAGGGGESLAQLYRGDFESLVAGKGRLPSKKKNALDRLRPTYRGERKQKQTRPALGIRKSVKAPSNRGHRVLVQSRLDIPIDNRTPTSKRKRSSHTPASARKNQPRPAIRLDDHTIFATDDFAFDDDDNNDVSALDDITPRPSKRVFGRTKSTTIATKEVETLDAGVGKARSWANFDKWSADFGISPLPSGLYCSAESIPGSGRLAELVDIIKGKTDIIVEPCVAYGVELYPSLTVSAIQAVVFIIFEKIYEATTAKILSSGADEVDLSPLAFLGAYAITATGDILDIVDDIRRGVKDITAKLDILDLPLGRSGQDARNVVLRLRWALFELAICLSRISPGPLPIDTAISLISLLLSSGFDKSIRPLKSILRGQSDTAEISDSSLTTWIATLQLLSHVPRDDIDGDTGLDCLVKALDLQYPHDQVGPIAAERIWYLVFGLCAVNQFDIHGCTSANYTPVPQWTLVRRAISLIKISHNEEAEEGAHLHQLQGRDRYIRIMLARCIRLSSVWQWPFDRTSFSIATKDLGIIFKDRQYRNLPTESPVDFPTFITSFDMTLTAALDTKRESAFELYLRLVCVAASDLISASESLEEAKRAERAVQMLVITIMPVSPVKFNRILPPTPRQLGQLINRYSTMVAATYFAPSILPWLLNCSKAWVEFENADFDSRQVSIRGLMYVAVACRHHGQSLDLVVGRLAEILGLLQKELDLLAKGSKNVHAPTRLEVERTMVMVVSCVKQVILHHTFDPDQTTVTYPDPSLLHESKSTITPQERN